MASLADLSELVGFFSYSREDDADSNGALSALRSRIQGELRGLLGRTAKTFRLWQDKEAIPSGTLWESEIKNAVGQSVFFIPIITPTVVASPYCRVELESFLAREAALGRDDLAFPILYIDVPALRDDARRQNDAVLSVIARRQYVDWREFRYLDVNSTEVKREIGRFCTHIRDALHRPWLSPEERKEQEEAAARERADVTERKLREAEARRRGEEEAEAERERIAALEAKAREDERRKQEAEEERRRREAEAEQQRNEETEAKRRAEEEARQRAAEAEAQQKAARTAAGNQPRQADLKSRPFNKKRVTALAVGGAVGLTLLALAGIWLNRNEGSSSPSSPSPQTPTCASGDSICQFCRQYHTDFYRDSSTCIYMPVCQAALNAVSARGISVGHYLTREDSHVSSTGGHVTNCSLDIWGVNAHPKSERDNSCVGDCLQIDFIWSGDIENPVVRITNVKTK